MAVHLGGRGPGHLSRLFSTVAAAPFSAIAADGWQARVYSPNLLAYTEEFDNAAWTKSSLSVTANAAVAPDGSTTAEKLYPSVSAGRIYRNVTTGTGSVFSFYAKAGEMTAVNIRAPNNSPAAIAYLDLNTGTVSGVNGSYGSASVTSVGNGWYRFVFVLTATLTAISFAPCDAAGSTASTPSGTNGIYAWGAQLEEGSVASAYVKMPTAQAPTDLSMLTATVNRAGYDQTGAATTRTETVYLTKRVRQAYSNQASFTENNVALSAPIFSADTVAGATNNSTLVGPKPIVNWSMVSRRTVGNSLDWELVAYHAGARPDGSGVGRQVACVKVRANDGTTQTAWQTATTTAISTHCEDLQPLEVYAGTLDITALATGAVWLEAEVYPWIGTVLKSEDNQTAGLGPRYFTRRYFRKDVSKVTTPAYVYVASTGNDTTGVCSTTAATAAASPCLTVNGAIVKANTTLGNTRGCLDNLRIRIVDTVAASAASFNAYKQDIGAIIVERAPGTARASAIVSMTGAFRPYLTDHSVGTEGAIIFNDVSLSLGVSGQFQGEAANNLFVQFWNCNFADASQFGGQRGNSHLAYFGTVFSAIDSALGQSANGEIRMMRGVQVDLNGKAPEGWVTLACKFTRAQNVAMADASKDGHIWASNLYLNPLGGSGPLRFVGSVAGGNLGLVAMVQNVIELLTTTDTVAIALSHDSANGNVALGSVVIHNTATGQHNNGRVNAFYDDTTGQARSHGLTCFKGNLTPGNNIKGDVFKSDGTKLGHFGHHHGVWFEGNFTVDHDASGQGATLGSGSETLSFGYAYGGRGSVIAGGDPLFTNYQAATWNGAAQVAGAGGGTYTLQAGSPAKNLLSQPLLAYDFAGNSRGTGTQHAGAYI